MARRVGLIDAVAVLGPVDDAHVVVSHSTRVLAVFTGPRRRRTASLLSRGAGVGLGDQVWLALFGAVLRRRCEREVAAMTCEATPDSPCGVQQRQPKPRRPGCLIC